MRSIRLSSLLLVLVLAGCATTSSVPTANQQAQAGQARQLFEKGQYRQAAQAYLALATRERGADDYFRLRAAEAWRQSGSLAHAAKVLARVERDRLQPSDARHYDLLEAEIALKHGQTSRALALIPASVAGLPVALQPRALVLRARALEAANRPWDAARARMRVDTQLTGAEQARNRSHTLKLLESIGAQALQQRASTLTPSDPAMRWIATALAQLGVAVARAAPQLSQPVGTLVPGAGDAEGYRLPRKVALLLPVSGPLAAAGNAVRQGFFASYFQAGAHADLPPVIVYDSRGTPSGAVAGYHKAVANGATLVVGPLTHDGVSAVMQQTSLPVTLLALNHPEGNVLPPPHVTEFALRPEAEGAQAARYMRQRGLNRAIVIVSSEDFAQRAANAFTAQFQGQGGRVTNRLTLNASVVDYATQIRALHGTGQAGTGIFISTRPGQARLLMPQLRVAGIALPVFATSRINDGRNNPIADGDLNGVVFSDAPWLFNAQLGLPPRAAMAAVLPAARSGLSARLFAFGMDAWSLVPYLDWLRSHPGSYLAGASGRLTEDAFGRVQRVLNWARFENGVPRPLTGSLELGTPMLQPAPAATATPVDQAPAPAASSAPVPAASVPAGM